MRRVFFWLANSIIVAFVGYFAFIRMTDEGVPAWAWWVAPPVFVFAIAYESWYLKTEDFSSD